MTDRPHPVPVPHFSIALLCLSLLPPALYSSAQEPSQEEQVISAWLEKAAILPPMEMAFVQERQLRALKKPLVREGTIWLGRDNRIRWQIDQPPSRILVHDGQSDQVLLFDETLKTVQKLSLNDQDRGAEAASLQMLMDSRKLTLDTFKQLFLDFYGAIESGEYRARPSYPTFQDGQHEILVCEAILNSHQRQSWVEIGDN